MQEFVDGDRTHNFKMLEKHEKENDESIKENEENTKENEECNNLQDKCTTTVHVILGLQEELEDYRHSIVELKQCIITRKHEIEQLIGELEVYNTRKANLKIEYERYALKKQGSVWMFIVISLFVSRYLLINAGLFLVSFFAEFVFLLNWRSLYVRNVPYSKPVGIGMILFLFIMIIVI